VGIGELAGTIVTDPGAVGLFLSQDVPDFLENDLPGALESGFNSVGSYLGLW
jgi:hypothetical protein